MCDGYRVVVVAAAAVIIVVAINCAISRPCLWASCSFRYQSGRMGDMGFA